MEKLVLVVPVFNEASRWNSQYWSNLTALSDIFWIFVNDGSTDQTSKLLTNLDLNQNGVVLSLEKNLGKAEAIRNGLEYFFDTLDSQNTLVGYLDADGAFTLEEILRFQKLAQKLTTSEVARNQQEFDWVWSSRVGLRGRHIQRKKSRHYIGRIIATYLGSTFPNLPYDSQSGFKIFKPSGALKTAVSKPFHTHWFIDLELLIRTSQIACREIEVWEEPLNSWRDVPGSALSWKNFLQIMIEIRYVKKMIKGNFSHK